MGSSPLPPEMGCQERGEEKGRERVGRGCGRNASSLPDTPSALYPFSIQSHHNSEAGTGITTARRGRSGGRRQRGCLGAWLTAALGLRWVCGTVSLSTAHTAFNLGRCLSLGSLRPHKGGWGSPPRPGLLAVPCTPHPVGTHNRYCLRTSAQFPLYYRKKMRQGRG